MVDHILGLGLPELHALVGGVSGRVGILDLGHHLQADLLGIGDPLGCPVLAPGRRAEDKTDPGFALPLVVFLDPFHQDHDLIAVGGAQGVVIGVFGCPPWSPKISVE